MGRKRNRRAGLRSLDILVCIEKLLRVRLSYIEMVYPFASDGSRFTLHIGTQIRLSRDI